MAERSDLLLMCLTNAEAVEAVMFGPDGVAAGSYPPLLIDFSSIHPEATKDLAARVKAETGMSWLDSPVSGGTQGAVSGTLTFMIGGSKQDFETARPVLASLGSHMTLMGPTGSGRMSIMAQTVSLGHAEHDISTMILAYSASGANKAT